MRYGRAYPIDLYMLLLRCKRAFALPLGIAAGYSFSNERLEPGIKPGNREPSVYSKFCSDCDGVCAEPAQTRELSRHEVED